MEDSDRSRLTRRRFVAASAVGLGAVSIAGIAAAGTAASADAASIGDREQEYDSGGLADTVLGAFNRYRLVAIGEVHGLQEHHDSLVRLMTDPRLPEVVDDVVVEFGNAFYQATMDRFTAGLPVDNVDLRLVWRNLTQSPLSEADAPVYEQFYRTIRAVNWRLPLSKQIRVLLGDPPIDWSKIGPGDPPPHLAQRNAYAASLVEREVLGKGRRALICYGLGHVFHGTTKEISPVSTLVARIEQQTAERVYGISTLVPLSGDPGGLGKGLARYPRGTVIPTAGTWLGAFDAGLIFPVVSPGATGQPVNAMCGIPLKSVIDAGLYLGQPDDLTMSRENPAIYLDPAYWAELQRRNALQGGVVDLDKFRHEQLVRFMPQPLPPSLQCS
jgi:hypothetical protein